MSAFRFIRLHEIYDVARITLARPPLNILTTDMTLELNEALERVGSRPTLKVLVLAGEGKAFCAGVAVEDHVGERMKPMLEAFHDVFRRLRRLECVTLAAVRGAAAARQHHEHAVLPHRPLPGHRPEVQPHGQIRIRVIDREQQVLGPHRYVRTPRDDEVALVGQARRPIDRHVDSLDSLAAAR